jgi:hypothetical protein
MSEVAETLEGLRESSESAKKKKYLTLPSAKAYNSILDVMIEDPTVEEILEDYFSGSEKNKAKNETNQLIIDAIEAKMKTEKDPNRLEVFQKNKEKLEKEIKNPNKVSMKLMLKYLLATNKNPAIQEIAEEINA